MVTAHDVPPGQFGLPYIGELRAFLADPYRFAHERFIRYGDVFKTRLFGSDLVILLSDVGQQQVLVTGQEHFANAVGYKVMEPFYGQSLLLTDGSFHEQQRKMMIPAFHGRAMSSYLATINRIVDVTFDNWGAGGTRALYPDVRALAFSLASAILVGIEVGDERDHMLELWRDFSQGNYGFIPLDVPFTKYGRALRARRQLDALLLQQITAHHQDTAMDQAVLHLLLQERDQAGAPIPTKLLLDQLRLLLFAGHDTTSGTLTWLVVELLRHPDLLTAIRAEVRADDHDAPITLEDVGRKPLLDAVLQETLRLYPQNPVVARGVVSDFTFGGYRIPAGWSVMLMPAFTQRRADYFADPDTFDPYRFLPPREEHKAHPYAWIGFGAGPHQCLGEGVAKLEIKAFLTRLLRRFDLTLLPHQDLTPKYLPLSRPAGSVQITYTAY